MKMSPRFAVWFPRQKICASRFSGGCNHFPKRNSSACACRRRPTTVLSTPETIQKDSRGNIDGETDGRNHFKRREAAGCEEDCLPRSRNNQTSWGRSESRRIAQDAGTL